MCLAVNKTSLTITFPKQNRCWKPPTAKSTLHFATLTVSLVAIFVRVKNLLSRLCVCLLTTVFVWASQPNCRLWYDKKTKKMESKVCNSRRLHACRVAEWLCFWRKCMLAEFVFCAIATSSWQIFLKRITRSAWLKNKISRTSRVNQVKSTAKSVKLNGSENRKSEMETGNTSQRLLTISERFTCSAIKTEMPRAMTILYFKISIIASILWSSSRVSHSNLLVIAKKWEMYNTIYQITIRNFLWQKEQQKLICKYQWKKIWLNILD